MTRGRDRERLLEEVAELADDEQDRAEAAAIAAIVHLTAEEQWGVDLALETVLELRQRL